MPELVDLIRATVRTSQRKAKAILADPKTAVLDTETTGLSSGAFIVDLAVIARGRTLINTLVNPQIPIPPGASEIHGIYDDDVRDAPIFDDIWPEFEKILRGRTVVIYNASYDIRIIGNEVNRLDPELKSSLNISVEDAMVLYQQWYFGGVGRSGKGQTKLVTAHCDAPACVAAVSKHQQAGAHRAYADCLATVERLKMIANSCWLEDHYKKAVR
jgi:DNA polymerase III epsilon subunit-like protein